MEAHPGRLASSAVKVAFISSVLCMTYFLAAPLGIAGSGLVRPGENWSRTKMTNLWSQVLNWLLTYSRSTVSPSPLPFWRSEETIHDTASGSPSFDYDSLTRWAKSHFESLHPAFLFLHGLEVLEVFEEFEVTGMSNIGEAETTSIRAVLSISLGTLAKRAFTTKQYRRAWSVWARSTSRRVSMLVLALGFLAILRNI